MYSRLLKITDKKSFFLFGPRGTGKTHWIQTHFPHGLYLDLLQFDLYSALLANPQRLEKMIPPQFQDWILIDEIQRIPELLNEVHRLIEKNKYSFILTGSSARSLRKKGVNLLAGRALTFHMYPLTAIELGASFDLNHALCYGGLPATFTEKNPLLYLKSYVETYLREEVLQEGLTRNLSAFTRFLEVASFSQASLLNLSEVARESQVNRKVIENYFQILEDLLLSWRLLPFTKKAKRKLTAHPKFYFFDVGVYLSLRPKGPMEMLEVVEGAALETLVLQELMAINDYNQLNYQFYYWKTQAGLEVDFVLYGPQKMIAIEVKQTKRISKNDLRALRQFKEDYPEAERYVFYGGSQKEYDEGIVFIPIEHALKTLPTIL